MRSPPLLLLLITTQCCLISSTFAASVRPLAQVAYEDLHNYSKKGLRYKIGQMEQQIAAAAAAQTLLQTALAAARASLSLAEESLADAEANFEKANEALENILIPRRQLDDDLNRTKKAFAASKRAASTARIQAKIPPDVENKTAFCVESVADLPLLERNLTNMRTVEIPQLEEKQRHAERVREELQKSIAAGEAYLESECAADEDDDDDEDCLNRREQLADMNDRLPGVKKAEKRANAALERANRELIERSEEVALIQKRRKYLEALALMRSALKQYKQAKERHKFPQEVTEAKEDVRRTLEAKNAAEAALPLAEKEVQRLEAEKEQARRAVAAATDTLRYYKAEYGRRADRLKRDITEDRLLTPELMWTLIVAGVALVLLVIGVIIFARCKMRKSHRTIQSEVSAQRSSLVQSENASEDARILDSKGQITLDVRAFKYDRVLLFTHYRGDLPHDKEKENTSILPETYTFVKDRMKFFFYGLREDRPKPPNWKTNPVQTYLMPGFLEGASDEDVLQIVKHEIPLPTEFASRVRAKTRKEEKITEVKLEQKYVRAEFLSFLHPMASKSHHDFVNENHDSRVHFEIPYLMWILSNAKKVLMEHHKSQLIKFNGSIVIVGDIHGQMPDLLRMFGQRATAKKPGWLTHNYLFLGDLVDRGSYSLEVVVFLFLLKILYPKHIMLIRGNHEERSSNENYGFLNELNRRYDERLPKKDPTNQDEKPAYRGPGKQIFSKINEVFEYMPIAALINNNIFCVHGGIGSQLLDRDSPHKTLEEHYGEIPIPWEYPPTTPATMFKKDLAFETIWNDPDPDERGFNSNRERECFFKFGIAEYRVFKKMYRISLVFRGHQHKPNGFHFPFDGTFLTTFSVPGYSSYNNRAATFDIDLTGKIGCQISARCAAITTKEEAWRCFQKYHVTAEGMKGEDISEEDTVKR